MKCKELIEYLERFAPDAAVSVVIGDPVNRVIHKVSKFVMLDPAEVDYAALLIEVAGTEPMDDREDDDE